MYTTITRDKLQEMKRKSEDMILIEVLGEKPFKESHIQGAINIPLKEIGHTVKEKYDKDQEIVVYCKDKECQASPTAAEKLDKLGYDHVYDYEAGKKDWQEAGLPMEQG